MTPLLTLTLLIAVAAAIRGLWSPCGLSMLSTLNPVAERGRGHRPGLTAAWYLAGALVGGVLLGAGCALVAVAGSRLPERMALALVAGTAVLTAVSDTRVFGRLFPDLPRQVNEVWVGTYRRWVYAAGFGVQIGTGFATYVMTAANYLLVVAAGCCPPGQALAAGVVFGAVRGATVCVGLWGSTPARLMAVMARVESAEPLSRAALIAVQLAVAGTAAALAGGAGVVLALASGLAAAAVVGTVAAARVGARSARTAGVAAR